MHTISTLPSQSSIATAYNLIRVLRCKEGWPSMKVRHSRAGTTFAIGLCGTNRASTLTPRGFLLESLGIRKYCSARKLRAHEGRTEAELRLRASLL